VDKIKVLIVEDQILFAESLKMVLEQRSEDIEKVDIEHNGLEALKRIEVDKPDVILMDIHMTVMNGVEASRLIKKKHPEIKIIILTMDATDGFINDALVHGAEGYMLKDVLPKELILAIKAVYEGSVLISTAIAKKLVQQIDTKNKEVENKETPPWVDDLSKREREVLSLISEGFDNLEIAEKLFIAEQTVKNYVSVIYTKLGTHNRYSAMRMWKSANIK